jgi:LacI family transcriptional regulator
LAATLKDIANQLNLSINTISRALRDMPDISQETKKLIIETAERVGYRKNLAASRLRTRHSYILGVVVTDVSNPAFSGIVKGAEEQVKAAGYTIMLGNTNENAADEAAVIGGMLAHGVDGILLVPSMQNREILSLIEDAGVPYVLAIRKFPDAQTEIVRNDDIYGASALAEYLYQLGHRRFLYVSGLWHISSTQEGYQGFLSSLKSQGLPDDALQLIKCDGSRTGTYKAIQEWLALYAGKELPATAIFAFNDYMVGGIYLALKEQNIRIPEDISIVGYDNNEYSDILEPSLTTVDNHFFEIGKQSAARLLDIIGHPDDENAKKPQEIIIMPELVVRNSAVSPTR